MQLTATAVPGATPSRGVTAAVAAGDQSLRVAQMNVWNLFDTVDDPTRDDDSTTPTPAEYEIRLEKTAKAIVELGLPDVISINEVENTTVMGDLVARPELAKAGYRFVIEPNNDERGISVGVLYRGANLEVAGVETPNPKFSFPDGGRGQIDRSLLYARPPLVVDFRLRGAAQVAAGSELLTVAVNHFKSKLGGAAPEARRVMQGQYLGEWLDARAAVRPGGATIVVGDLNAVYGDGAYEKLATKADGSARFHDAPLALKESDRYTYIYRGKKNLLDHMLVSAARKDAITGVEILHVNTAKGAHAKKLDPTTIAGSSDHDPMVVDFDVKRLLGARKS